MRKNQKDEKKRWLNLFIALLFTEHPIKFESVADVILLFLYRYVFYGNSPSEIE
jgi:hypothetical protein